MSSEERAFAQEAFSRWLENELHKRQWSQADLARKANVSQTAISNVLSGERVPGPDFCRAIAGALGVPEYTVLYLAGLLEELPPDFEQLSPEDTELLNLFQQLTPDEQDDILAYLRRRAQRIAAKGRKKQVKDRFKEYLWQRLNDEYQRLLPEERRILIQFLDLLLALKGRKNKDK